MICTHLKQRVLKLNGWFICKKVFKTETKGVTKLLFMWPYLRTVGALNVSVVVLKEESAFYVDKIPQSEIIYSIVLGCK
jgi:hypothetical protein